MRTADNNLPLARRNQSLILKLAYANGTGSGNIWWESGQCRRFTDQYFADGLQTALAIYNNGERSSQFQQLILRIRRSSRHPRASRELRFPNSTRYAPVGWQYLPGYFSFGREASTFWFCNGDVEFDSRDHFNSASAQVTGGLRQTPLKSYGE
jgi:hypothetical protein